MNCVISYFKYATRLHALVLIKDEDKLHTNQCGLCYNVSQHLSILFSESVAQHMRHTVHYLKLVCDQKAPKYAKRRCLERHQSGATALEAS